MPERARIEVLNPNSSREVTAAMAACVRRMGRPEHILLSEIAEAPAGIETDAHVAAVAPLVARRAARCEADALVVACFSDPGVTQARAACPIPVIGIAEAAYREGARHGRFGVVSLGPSSVARHAVQIERMGLTAQLAGDLPAHLTVAEGLDPASAPAVESAARRLLAMGADCVILGCAGLGGGREALEGSLGVPVIDPVQAGVRRAAAMLEDA